MSVCCHTTMTRLRRKDELDGTRQARRCVSEADARETEAVDGDTGGGRNVECLRRPGPGRLSPPTLLACLLHSARSRSSRRTIEVAVCAGVAASLILPSPC